MKSKHWDNSKDIVLFFLDLSPWLLTLGVGRWTWAGGQSNVSECLKNRFWKVDINWLSHMSELFEETPKFRPKNSLGKCYFFSENFIFKEGGVNPVIDTILKVVFDVKALQIWTKFFPSGFVFFSKWYWNKNLGIFSFGFHNNNFIIPSIW